jgi:hypothetical protein
VTESAPFLQFTRNSYLVETKDERRKTKAALFVFRLSSFVVEPTTDFQQAVGGGRDQLLSLVVGALAWLLVTLAPVTYASADPRGSLLTTQAIIEYGTFKLDAYDPPLDYRVAEQNGHRYYTFPPGSSLIALPAVWLANQAGLHMARPNDDALLQKHLAALSVALAGLLIYRFCRRRLPTIPALLLTLSFTFGSAVISTLGTAFWSSNAALLLLLLALGLPGDRIQLTPAMALPGGLLLGVAYLVRPTAALFALVLTLYLAWRNWRNALWLVGGFLIVLGLWSSFALREYGQLLPAYYMPSRASGGSFFTALPGHLVSPARGLLIYSPFLLVIAIAAIGLVHKTRLPPLCWLALIWFGLHLLVVASFPHWWGGSSYGPRLLAEALPALLAISVWVWQQVRALQPARVQWALSACYSLATAVAVIINSGQGLFNPATSDWNALPPIDAHPEHLFDWRYPQFLATSEQLARRSVEQQLRSLEPYLPGTRLNVGSNAAIFENWYTIEQVSEGTFRWSSGPRGRISFVLAEDALRHNEELTLEIAAGSYLQQPIELWLNDSAIGTIASQPCSPQQSAFRVPAALLRSAPQLNSLELRVAASARPAERIRGNSDTRDLGVCMWWVAIDIGR